MPWIVPTSGDGDGARQRGRGVPSGWLLGRRGCCSRAWFIGSRRAGSSSARSLLVGCALRRSQVTHFTVI